MLRNLLLLVFLILTSCAAQHSVQVQKFVDSSKEYLDASDVLLQQAKDSVRANNRAPYNARFSTYQQNDDVYYELVRQLRKQRSLLYSYFVSITALSQPNNTNSMASSVAKKLSWMLPDNDSEQEKSYEEIVALPQKIANVLILVNRKIEATELNGQRIESLMEHSPAILVTNLGNVDLENELRQRETMIRYSLSLHRAAMQAISMKMDIDLGQLAKKKEVLRQKVETKFDNAYHDPNHHLSHCWSANRTMLLEEISKMEENKRDMSKAASLAEEGAHYMQRAFRSVLEGERELYELPLLDVKTKELSALLATSARPTFNTLPEDCQNVVVSIEQVQSLPLATKAVQPVAIARQPRVEPKPMYVPVTVRPIQKPIQQEYTRKAMNQWANKSQYGPIQKGDTLYSIAKNMRVDGRYSVSQVMAALFKSNTSSFNMKKLSLLKLDATLTVPSAKEVERLSAKQASDFVRTH